MSFRRALVLSGCVVVVGAATLGVIWLRTPRAQAVKVSEAELLAALEEGSGAEVIALDSTDIHPANLEEARELWGEDELALARAALEAALQEPALEGDDEGTLHVLLAVVCRRQREGMTAVEHGHRGAELCPTSGAAHHVYARAIAELMRDGGALAWMRNMEHWREELRTAIELDPTNLDARTEELFFYSFAPKALGGSPERAEELLLELEQHDPVRTVSLRVGVLVLREDLDGAMTLVAEALEAHPDDPTLLVARGDLHAKASSFNAADSDYIAAAGERPVEAGWRAVFQRAKLRLDLDGDADEALAFLDEYANGAPRAEYMPSPAHHQIQRSRALVRLGKIEEARAAYEAGIALDDKADREGVAADELEAAADRSNAK